MKSFAKYTFNKNKAVFLKLKAVSLRSNFFVCKKVFQRIYLNNKL